MSADPVVDEIRAAREAYAARFGFDLTSICQDLRASEAAGGRRPMTLPPRRPEPIHPIAEGSAPSRS